MDKFGNVETGYAGTVHFTSTDAAAVLPPDYTFTPAGNGTAVFQVTIDTAGGQTVTAADTVNSKVTGKLSVTAS